MREREEKKQGRKKLNGKRGKQMQRSQDGKERQGLNTDWQLLILDTDPE
jgi:hypothetical protein